jgi:transcriptional regulator with XRE-family HTH domain
VWLLCANLAKVPKEWHMTIAWAPSVEGMDTESQKQSLNDLPQGPFCLTPCELLESAFGMVLKGRREAMGTSAKRFAAISGVSYSNIRKIEKGDASPRLVTIARIASALDDEPGELVSEASRIAVEYSSVCQQGQLASFVDGSESSPAFRQGVEMGLVLATQAFMRRFGMGMDEVLDALNLRDKAMRNRLRTMIGKWQQ